VELQDIDRRSTKPIKQYITLARTILPSNDSSYRVIFL
jgi:hypothetical protein